MMVIVIHIKIEIFFFKTIYHLKQMNSQMKEEQKKIDDFYIQQLKEIILGTYKQIDNKKEIIVHIEDLPFFKNKIKFAQEEQKKIDDFHIQQLKEIINHKNKIENFS